MPAWTYWNTSPAQAVGRNAIFLPRKNQGDINFGRRIRTFDHGVMVLSSRFARDIVLLLLNKSAVLTTWLYRNMCHDNTRIKKAEWSMVYSFKVYKLYMCMCMYVCITLFYVQQRKQTCQCLLVNLKKAFSVWQMKSDIIMNIGPEGCSNPATRRRHLDAAFDMRTHPTASLLRSYCLLQFYILVHLVCIFI